jgi:hypothetical protein
MGDWAVSKPQFPVLSLVGLRNWAGMPLRGAQACPEAKTRSQGLATLIPPAQQESSGLAEAPIQVNQTKSNQIKPEQKVQSSKFKVQS